MRTLVISAMLVLALACMAQAQDDPKTPPRPMPPGGESNTGPPRSKVRIYGRVYVGDPAPDFSLWGSRDRELRLSSLRGGWVLLSFGSSRQELAELRSIQNELRELGVTILGVCSDKPQTLRAFAERDSVPFEMLCDPTGEISAIYGLYDQPRRSILPGFLVLDRQGVVRLAILGQAVPPTQLGPLVRFGVLGF